MLSPSAALVWVLVACAQPCAGVQGWPAV